MRTSHLLLSTLRETPADAELISHKLMLRAGMIRRLASGLYTWLPLGLRVLKKVENIIRQEMDKTQAQEILMPAVQPAELWEESQRWDAYGHQLLKIKDRHERLFCFGPTHEEVVTDLMRREIRSYKQLPLCVYQIQTKFRDEIRPRFGVMRAREFLMKDAYSFHLDNASRQKTYESMFHAYQNIFTRLGLRFRAVMADSGTIGGDASHEFQVLADSGEDLIAYSEQSDYAANIERAEAIAPTSPRAMPTQAMRRVPKTETTQGASRVKLLIVKGTETPWVCLVLDEKHTLNEVKAQRQLGVATPLHYATKKDFPAPSLISLDMPIIADHSAACLADFVCESETTTENYQFVNWSRDVKAPITADIRNVEAGDASPDGQGTLSLTRGIEVGHIFDLGTKYSEAMDATVLNEQGKATPLSMGCYGIGVSRIVAAAIEQRHDERGPFWTDAMAPFSVAIIPMNMHKSHRVRELAEGLYEQLRDNNIEVLFDDRKERPGVLFSDMDLLGIPHCIIIGERGIDKGIVEYKNRRDDIQAEWEIDSILAQLAARLA